MARATKGVDLVVPAELVLDMFRRADRFDVDSGGRFDRKGAAIPIWSAPLGGADASEPQGEAHFLFSAPGPGQATIWRIGWDPGEGGSEAVVWEALSVLAGKEIRPA